MITRRTLLKTISLAGWTLVVPPVHAAPMLPASRPNLHDPDYDPVTMFKTVLTTGLGQIPEVGWLVSGLVSLLWPSDKPDIWAQIRERVERMIDEKIDDTVYSLLKAKLDGLGDVLKQYLSAVKLGDNEAIRMQFIATNTEFVGAAPQFQNEKFAWVLAPLCAMFTNLHMTLLRDAVLNGKGWGWRSDYYAGIVKQAGDTASRYGKYLDKVMADGKARLDRHAPSSPGMHNTDIYAYYRPFYTKRTLLIDDFRTLLTCLDPTQHAGKVTDIPFKDVYSAAYGTADDWDVSCAQMSGIGVDVPYSRPLSSIASIHVEYFNATPRVVDVSYPTGKGPEMWRGEGRTDRYGIIADDLDGVEKQTFRFPPPADGKRYNIVAAHLRSGDTPLELGLEFDDGSMQTLWNRTDLGGTRYIVSVPGRMLTTLNMWTRSGFYDSDLGCIIFGFSVDTRYTPPAVRELMYVSAVAQPNTGPDCLPRSISTQLQSRRDAFWRDVTAHVPGRGRS
ncbi:MULTISPECIES: insecticidal delta-endotoxin Cry8Ea1 family protein [unclassified Burkholderia]|uniref:insecticidal delta-endotoxin Cry8Ea1 family protein n=1 Tax=unclassified Burkholderia TaxID=2613784 RepID=UPI00075BBE94|nr:MULTISPECIES: insecticidal delta-endotoxin Cry8Ea1 family protein [unclassified Burkholderia]KUY99817.1 twin-arginine translocation pathway signal [Burkholderia sp. RF7-non_BP1]KUZ03952.1 twin-arginine translocation pathway signal [Burkholderia sp. RF7-non_BP4]